MAAKAHPRLSRLKLVKFWVLLHLLSSALALVLFLIGQYGLLQCSPRGLARPLGSGNGGALPGVLDANDRRCRAAARSDVAGSTGGSACARPLLDSIMDLGLWL